VQTTQEEITLATGLSRETANKHLHVLQERGMISLSRGRIWIVDLGRIEE